MGVDVRDRLPRLRAGVEDDAVATAVYPLRLGHLVRLLRDLGQQPYISLGQRRQVWMMILGDDKDMCGRLRVDVAKRKSV